MTNDIQPSPVARPVYGTVQLSIGANHAKIVYPGQMTVVDHNQFIHNHQALLHARRIEFGAAKLVPHQVYAG